MSESLQNLKLAILNEFNRTEKSFHEDIETLQKWIREQEHFPKIELNDIMVGNALIRNKFSIERAKQKIDTYFTIRSHAPELYKTLNPSLEPDKNLHRKNLVVLLPKKAEDPIDYLMVKYTKKCLNLRFIVQQVIRIIELYMRNTYFCEEVFILDVSNAVLDDIYQINPFLLAKSLKTYLAICSMRIKAIYILYTPPFAEKFMSLMKNAIKPKMLERIHFEKDSTCLASFLTTSQIPKEYGGEGPSLEELAETQNLDFMENQDFFDKVGNMMVDEDLRRQQITPTDDDFFGNFKKLDVD